MYTFFNIEFGARVWKEKEMNFQKRDEYIFHSKYFICMIQLEWDGVCVCVLLFYFALSLASIAWDISFCC